MAAMMDFEYYSLLGEQTERFEGRSLHMYLCPAGRVTIGVGHAIEREDAALAMPFLVDGLPATAGQITRDFRAIAASTRGRVASAYASATRCRLTDVAVTGMRDADVERYERSIARAVPGWENLPVSARCALFDIGFNCGVAGLLKFHRMLAAVESRNWHVAALESHRADVSWSRNSVIASLLREAAAEEQVAAEVSPKEIDHQGS